MPTEKFTFTGHSGHELAARLDLPQGPHLATALFAHCFTCGKDIAAARRIAGRLSAMGFAVLRFDFTGLGHSEGEFANTSFVTNVEDLVAAADALAARGMAPALLIGHSLGGAAVLAAAPQIDSVKAVATIGAPYDPAHVLHHVAHARDEIEAKGAAEVLLAGRPVRIGRAFLEDAGAGALEKALPRLGRALLVMHAPLDTTVGIDSAAEIFTAARHPKSFVTLDGADHLLTDPKDADYAAGVIAAWVTRYLDLSTPAPPAGVPEGVTRVTEADKAGLLSDVAMGHHHLRADEPLEVGGTDLGPSPYQLLTAALGACTAMTVRLYARRKGWPLDKISVEVTHSKSHATDAIEGRQKVDTFHRTIMLEGPLDEDQRARLLEIADKCPVQRTLHGSSEIVSTLAPVH